MDFTSLKTWVTTFCPMPDEEFARIEPITSWRQVAKGAFLLQQGEVCRHIFFLTQGFTRMYYVDPTGAEMNYRFAHENEFLVDFSSFLTRSPSRYYWQAMQDLEVLTFSYEPVQSLYQKSAAWNQFGRLMAERVYLLANERTELLQFLTPEQRYQHVLHTYPELVTSISQAYLASYLGIKPESLSRIRHRLANKSGS